MDIAKTEESHITNLCTENQIEIGAFVSALQEFSKSPILGGMGGKGFGICDADFIADGDEFAEITNERFNMSEKAENALNTYDSFVMKNKDKIINFLEDQK